MRTGLSLSPFKIRTFARAGEKSPALFLGGSSGSGLQTTLLRMTSSRHEPRDHRGMGSRETFIVLAMACCVPAVFAQSPTRDELAATMRVMDPAATDPDVIIRKIPPAKPKRSGESSDSATKDLTSPGGEDGGSADPQTPAPEPDPPAAPTTPDPRDHPDDFAKPPDKKPPGPKNHDPKPPRSKPPDHRPTAPPTRPPDRPRPGPPRDSPKHPSPGPGPGPRGPH
jgi:hypothetical protein